MKANISIVIPCRNDAENLSACLPLLVDFDDVQIIDSESVDGTREVAARWSRPVVQFKWDGKFPKKRNWALRNCSFRYAWVLFLDADERMTESWSREVSAFLESPVAERTDVLTCCYDNWFMGRLLRHGDPMQKTAMARIGAAEYEKIDEEHWSDLDMEVHEHLQPKRKGAEYAIQARLEHHDKRSLESHWQKHVQYASWEASRYRQLMAHRERWAALTSRQRRKYANISKWWFAWVYFCWCYFARGGFLDGWVGLRFAWFKLRYFRLVRKVIRKTT